jgi:hypothetical protein
VAAGNWHAEILANAPRSSPHTVDIGSSRSCLLPCRRWCARAAAAATATLTGAARAAWIPCAAVRRGRRLMVLPVRLPHAVRRHRHGLLGVAHRRQPLLCATPHLILTPRLAKGLANPLGRVPLLALSLPPGPSLLFGFARIRLGDWASQPADGHPSAAAAWPAGVASPFGADDWVFSSSLADHIMSRMTHPRTVNTSTQMVNTSTSRHRPLNSTPTGTLTAGWGDSAVSV